jgi:CheY-like chemotaxis protein
MKNNEAPVTPAGLGPECLLISASKNLVGTLLPMLESLRVRAEVCPDAREGVRKVTQHKFDAIFIDCTHGAGGVEAIRMLRSLATGKRAIMVAIVKNYFSMRDSFRAGATFVLDDPLPPDMTAKVLRLAYGFMVGERRRSLRHPMETSVDLRLASGANVRARSVNLSERGMGLVSPVPLEVGRTVPLRFVLPGGTKVIAAIAEITWADPSGKAGLRFVSMPARAVAEIKEFTFKLLPRAVTQAA